MTPTRTRQSLTTAVAATATLALAAGREGHRLDVEVLPVGKAFLGSVAQNLILDADVPVLVVKSPRWGRPGGGVA